MKIEEIKRLLEQHGKCDSEVVSLYGVTAALTELLRYKDAEEYMHKRFGKEVCWRCGVTARKEKAVKKINPMTESYVELQQTVAELREELSSYRETEAAAKKRQAECKHLNAVRGKTTHYYTPFCEGCGAKLGGE